MSSSILLVKDESLDLELALIALKRARMDSELTVVRDGQQAMDNLFCQNSYANREPDNPRPRHPRLAPQPHRTPGTGGHARLREFARYTGGSNDNSRDPMAQQKARELNVSAYIVASLSTLLAPDGAPSKPQTKPHWR
nr:hypothetical protein [Pseudomonas sp.]